MIKASSYFVGPQNICPTKTLGSINHNSFSLDKKLQKLQRAKKEAGKFSNYQYNGILMVSCYLGGSYLNKMFAVFGRVQEKC